MKISTKGRYAIRLMLDLASDTKRIQDLKGNHLLLFTSYWSIDWALEHNKGLELREFGTDW